MTDRPKSLVGAQSRLCIVMTSCGKIETIIDSPKVTGAKGDLCPGSFMSTGANAPVAPVESAPMLEALFSNTDHGS